MAATSLRDAYDAVVVGAGLAGLTAANRLARAGRSVLVAEAHWLPGGYATYFRRGGHVFDVALHAFPGGMAKSFRKYWNAELAGRVMRLDAMGFENPQFSLATRFDREDFTRLLDERFDVPPPVSAAFFDACRRLTFYDDAGRPTRALFEEYFPGRPDVWRLLLDTVTYATGANLDDPALCYGIVFSNFVQGGIYTLHGGTDAMLADMQAELARNGATLALRTPVRRIVVERGRAAGVELADGRVVRARAVVSNANLHTTVLDFLADAGLPAAFAREAEAAPLSVSVAQVYLGLAPGATIPRGPELLFVSSEPAYDAAAYRRFPPTSRSYSFYYPNHIRPDHGRTEIACSMCADYDDWAGLAPDAYARRKGELVENVLTDLERRIPGLRDLVDHVEAATPRTLERYAGHRRGASFGTKFPGYAVSDRLPEICPGVFHTGSTGILMSGWLGAVNYGALTAARTDAYLG